MIEAKLTTKGQITIPIEIRRMLDLHPGDQVSFIIKENGIMLDKTKRALTIEERFANYDVSNKNKELSESMEEIDTGEDVGKEDTDV